MAGLISGIKAVYSVKKLNKGKKAMLSIGQITNLIVNMPDAQKNLSKEQFQSVYSMYLAFTKCHTKMLVDLGGYYETACQIISVFNKLAPYELYSGGNKIETKFLLQEVNKMEAENPEFSSGVLNLVVGDTLNKTRKPKKKAKTAFVFIFILALLILTTAISVLFLKEYNKNIDLQNQIYELDSEMSRLEKQYIMVKNTRDNVIKTRDSMKEELDFWENNAVIVTESGSKYHRNDCQYVQNKQFLIYNVENAIHKGYEPCAVCDPPTR